MGSTPVPKTYSASRVSAIIGLNSFQTPLDVFQVLKEENEPGWNAKHGYKLPDRPEGPALRWGHAFEAAVIKLAEGQEDDPIINREKLSTAAFTKKGTSIEATTGPPPSVITLSCHQDGEFQAYKDNKLVLFEGKTTNIRAFYSSKTEIEESLDEEGEVLKDFVIVKKWGEPGTDEVPTEYQVQTAVQRICTGADLVKLSVLVFLKTQQEFEDEGVTVSNKKLCFDKSGSTYEKLGGEYALYKDGKYFTPVMDWARVFAQMGYFHTYNLPSHPKLEAEIIKAVQEFHTNHVLTGLPPAAKNYDDIKRLLSNPMGTIIATDAIKKLANEYSELTRQLGASSPNAKRKESVKIELLNLVNESRRDDWSNPPDKIVVLDPNGGAELVKFGQDKNGNLRFSAKRAR